MSNSIINQFSRFFFTAAIAFVVIVINVATVHCKGTDVFAKAPTCVTYDKNVSKALETTWTDMLFVPKASMQQMYSISGRVTNSGNGQSVQASIVIYKKTADDKEFYAFEKTMLNADGSYTISLPSDAQYKVSAISWSGEYETQYYQNSASLENATALILNRDYTNIDFTLSKKPVYDNGIRGVVTNSKGEGIGATVMAKNISSPNAQTYEAMSDKYNSGAFTISNLVPGQYVLYVLNTPAGVSRDGYYRINENSTNDLALATVVTVAPSGINSSAYVIRMAESVGGWAYYGIKGIVFDEKGQALEGVRISLIAPDGTVLPMKQIIRTDASGYFSIELNESGKYQLTAHKDGYSDANAGIYVDDNSPNMAVTLTMSAIDNTQYDNGVSGSVIGDNGQAVFAKVAALKLLADGSIGWNNPRSSFTVVTDKAGNFTITNLSPGRYVLFASPGVANYAPGYYLAGSKAVENPAMATVIEVQEKGVNTSTYIIILGEAVVKSSYELYGYISDENGSPLEGVTVTAIDANGNEVIINQNNVTDRGGYFHITFNGPGTYVVHAVKEGYQDASGTLTFDTFSAVQKTMIVMEKTQGLKKLDAQILACVNQDDLSVKLHPLPAHSMLRVGLARYCKDLSLRVYDMTGQIVPVSYTTDMNSAEVNIGNLQSGTYVLHLYDGGLPLAPRVFVKE